MATVYPGTTVEASRIHQGDSRKLFDGIFATGGITLSQVSVMTALEPYVIQNWVKRGFLPPPQKRLYSKEQFARIVIINMLKGELHLERICALLRLVDGEICANELYHRYVDYLSASVTLPQDELIIEATESFDDLPDLSPDARRRLGRVLYALMLAHEAQMLRAHAEQAISSLLN